MPLDNSALIAPFVPETDDGDTFIYTELIDRTRTKGNNGHRLLRTFYHRSREEFDSQLPEIRAFCEAIKVRAYTHLCKRGWEKTGKEFLVKVAEAAASNNWAGMKSLYQHTQRVAAPKERLWMWDVDKISDISERFGKWLAEHANPNWVDMPDGSRTKPPLLVATIPSRKGVHYISRGFQLSRVGEVKPAGMAEHQSFLQVESWLNAHEITLHKEGPTNLYIPDGAE